jgi:outer membrane receptor protein involved in Fe transport
MLTQELEEVVVSSRVIDVAKERVTPVAVSTITASDVTLKVGNLEFPEIMNNTPGVYATKQGGGYGDSRISLRGFSQSNTAFLSTVNPLTIWKMAGYTGQTGKAYRCYF